jgi:hypothetical protein
LFNVSGTKVISISIDPFFFKISWHEGEEEGEELDLGNFERLEIKGLKYLGVACSSRAWRSLF